MTLEELTAIVDTPGRLLALYEKHGLEPNSSSLHFLVAVEFGISIGLELGSHVSAGLSAGFDGYPYDKYYRHSAYELGRRARIACGLGEAVQGECP